MKSPWAMRDDQRKVADFTDSLAEEMEQQVKGYDGLQVSTSPLANNSGFIIGWEYAEKHSGSIMVSSDRGEEGRLVIDLFWGVSAMRTRSGQVQSSFPEELRNAAKIYEDVGAFLKKKFGNPVSEHDGRTIYIAQLEKAVGK